MKVSHLTKKNPQIVSPLKKPYLQYTKLFINKKVYFIYFINNPLHEIAPNVTPNCNTFSNLNMY